jgi:hypothetical protein
MRYRLNSIGHEHFSIGSILSNEQYNEYTWYSVKVHKTNMYNHEYQSYGKRYMPVFYEY